MMACYAGPVPARPDPGVPPGWCTFDLSLVSGIEALPGRFQVSPEFRPDSPAYRDIIIDCLRGWARAGDSS
jgi:hypothetical protein